MEPAEIRVFKGVMLMSKLIPICFLHENEADNIVLFNSSDKQFFFTTLPLKFIKKTVSNTFRTSRLFLKALSLNL